VKIERTKLYELVWEFPLSKVAPRFGISDRGLSKACERYAIPTPPPGFWWKSQAQNVRLMARIRPSTATPYHSTIMVMVEDGRKVAEILEAIRPLGYPGSISSLTQYIARQMRGKTRFVRSRNQYSSFISVRASAPARMAERPPLSDGPLWCYIGEREPKDPEKVESIGGETLLEMIAPELNYAREHDPELFKAFWFAVGTELPPVAYTALTWDMVTGNERWVIKGPLGINPNSKERRILTMKVGEIARNALQEFRKSSGRVLIAPHTARARLGFILGPEWQRHVVALRKEVEQTEKPADSTSANGE
jgi:hypothetical protein